MYLAIFSALDIFPLKSCFKGIGWSIASRYSSHVVDKKFMHGNKALDALKIFCAKAKPWLRIWEKFVRGYRITTVNRV